MKRLWRSFLLCALVSASCLPTACAATGGSGRPAVVQPALAGYSRVWLSHACQARIRQGDRFAVEVRIDDNLLEFLVLERNGDVLSIGLEDGTRFTDYDLEADITLPALQELRLSGASTAELVGTFAGPAFQCQLSGASRLRGTLHPEALQCKLSGASRFAGLLETGDASFRLSGASRLNVDGSGQRLLLRASGASQAHLAGFRSGDAAIDLSGASSGDVQVFGRLDAELSGASRLKVSGKAIMGRIATSGGSRLEAARP